MKTTKLILVSVLMAIATIGFSQSKAGTDNNQVQTSPELAINISLTSALNNPGIVRAMRQQLEPSFLIPDQRWYTVPVIYQHTVYYVTGSYDQWRWFFSLVEKAPAEA